MALLLVGQVTIVVAGQQHKPQPPVKLVIAPLGQGVQTIKPGDTVQLAVSATGMLEIDEMVIETSFLGGAEYVSGERRWQGGVQRNEVKTLTLTVRSPLHGTGKVRARVSLYRTGHLLTTKQALYDLGTKAESGPSKTVRPSRRDAKGREIVDQ